MSLVAAQVRDILKDKMPDGIVVPQHNERGHFYLHVPTGQLFASVTTKCGILDAPHLKKWAARLAVEHMLENRSVIMNGLSEEREMLAKNAILVHQDHFEEAGDVGTRGHGVVDAYLQDWMATDSRPQDIRTFITETDSRVFAIARSAELFCKEWNVIPVASEMFIVSLKHKFAGTMDSLMMVLNVKKNGVVPCGAHTFLSMSTTNPNKVQCIFCKLSGEYELAIVDWKSSNSIDKVEYAMQTAAYWQGIYEMTGIRCKRIYIVRLDKSQAKYEVRVLTDRVAAFNAFRHATHIYDWLNDGHEKLIPALPKQAISFQTI